MTVVANPTTKAVQPRTIKDHLESDALKDAIAKILPKHVTSERMARVAIAAITRTPKLKECDQSSFFQALMNLSQWGLEPDGRRAHLIPFKNRRAGIVECQLIIDYKGLVELAMRSGTVSKIHADVVCENDQFEYDRGEIKKHSIDFRKPRGEAYAAYAIVTMKDGSEKCDVMSRDEIEAIRKRSRAGSSGPWVTDWNEMAKKTVFRRATKWIQLSAEIRDAVEGDDNQFDGIATATIEHRGSVANEAIQALESMEGDVVDVEPEVNEEPVADAAADGEPDMVTVFLNDIQAAETSDEVSDLISECEHAIRDMPEDERKEIAKAVNEAAKARVVELEQ